MTFTVERGFSIAAREFSLNTGLSGFKYIFMKRNIYERVFWVIATTIILVIAIILNMRLWDIFMDKPILTSLESVANRVENVPFPQFTICGINRISKRKAAVLANRIAKVTSADKKKVKEKIKYLGGLLDFELTASVKELNGFQKILDKYFDSKRTGYSDIKKIMEAIAPPCDLLFKSCSWGNKITPCDELFSMELTIDGYCCTFRYEFQAGNNSVGNTAKHSKYVHQESGNRNGLSITLDNDLDDYMYTSLSTQGIKVTISRPYDFIDQVSGGSYQYIIGVKMVSFIQIVPVTVESVAEIRRYSPQSRGCLFENEEETIFGPYSSSNCWVDCRLNTIWLLCECVPFMFPVMKNRPVCTLSDIPCLEKNKGKWNSVSPYSDVKDYDSLGKELFNGLHCRKKCYPNCDEVKFGVFVNSVPLGTYDNEDVGNITRIHVFYDNPLSHKYRVDVVYYWFEIISLFGGITSLALGFSIMSFVELMIYFTCKCMYYSFSPDK